MYGGSHQRDTFPGQEGLFPDQEVVVDTAHGEDVHHAGGAPFPQQHLRDYPAVHPRPRHPRPTGEALPPYHELFEEIKVNDYSRSCLGQR